VRKSFERIESDLPEMIKSLNASRVLIDSISVLETLFNDAERYRILSSLRRMMKSAGITAIITSEADKFLPTASKFGILEYVCDGMICLKMIRRGGDFVIRSKQRATIFLICKHWFCAHRTCYLFPGRTRGSYDRKDYRNFRNAPRFVFAGNSTIRS
ncbi:MAG: ATPase domain-containing protein, partial [Archaeoglobaceae archaeon]